MTSTVDVLLAARKLIERPENWGRGPRSRRVNRLCASEALITAADNTDRSDAFNALHRGTRDIFADIPTWNDSCTHAEVLAAFDRAIAAERAKESA